METDLHRLAGAYALGALRTEEAAFYERHLAVCEACRDEVSEYLETAARLGMAASETPPEGMRAAVLAAVSQTRQVRPEVTMPLRYRLRSNLTAVAAVLTVAVLSLGAATLYLMQQVNGADESTAIVNAVGELVDADDVRRIVLDPANGVAGGMSLLVSDSQDAALLVGRDMVASEPGEALQLWLFHDGEPVPAAVAPVDADGTVQVLWHGSVVGAELAAVTIEPAEGSPAPTGDVLVSAELD